MLYGTAGNFIIMFGRNHRKLAFPILIQGSLELWHLPVRVELVSGKQFEVTLGNQSLPLCLDFGLVSWCMATR